MKQFDLAIKKLLRDFNKTIVVYSAIFPFAKLIKEDPKKYCLGLIDILKYNTDSLFMPTFTNGFTNGVCNLDKEKSTTGALTEIFRTLKNTKRTFCPFFRLEYTAKLKMKSSVYAQKKLGGQVPCMNGFMIII